MRSIIAFASLALLLSSCGSESPTPTSTPSTSPAALFTPSSESASRTEGQLASPADGAGGSGNPAEGETLFRLTAIAGAPGCVACHSLQPGVRMVGPSMADAATVATGAVAGLSAEDYLRQSIVEPDAHITEGFMPGLMPRDYGSTLSTQQINDLVAFLLTQT